MIYQGVDPLTGRERRRWHPGGESREETELLAARLAATATAVVRPPGPTLAGYLLRQWLPTKEVSLRPSTWDGYRRLIEHHVVPRLGAVSLRRLRADQLEALYAELLATGRRNGRGGLDPKTVLEVHVVLRNALADARRRGLVIHNVADDAETPKRRRPNAVLRAWNAEQLQTFLTVTRSKRLFPAYW